MTDLTDIQRLAELKREASFANLAAAKSHVLELQEELAALRTMVTSGKIVPGAEAAWSRGRSAALTKINQRLALARADEAMARLEAGLAQGRASVLAQLSARQRQEVTDQRS